MSSILSGLLNIFRSHKLKLFTFVAAFVVFLILLFPFSDLGDLVTAQVSELTNQQVYLSSETLGIALFPQPGLKMTKVKLETPLVSNLDIEGLFVSTSILGLITFRPGLRAQAEGLLGGLLDLSTRGGEALPNGIRQQKIDLSASQIDLRKLTEMLSSPIPLRGNLDVNIDGTVDPSFSEQPEAELKFSASPMKWSGGSIPTQLGAFPVPDLSFKNIEVEGDLKKGKLTLRKADFGKSGDELVVKITGQVDLRISGVGGFAVSPSAYDLNVLLQVRPGFAQKVDLFLSFLGDCKKPSGSNAAQYSCKISANSFQSPPKIAPL